MFTTGLTDCSKVVFARLSVEEWENTNQRNSKVHLKNSVVLVGIKNLSKLNYDNNLNNNLNNI